MLVIITWRLDQCKGLWIIIEHDVSVTTGYTKAGHSLVCITSIVSSWLFKLAVG